MTILVSAGWFEKLYGPEFLPRNLSGTPSPEQQAAITIANQWGILFAFPLTLAGIIWILRNTSTSKTMPFSFAKLIPNLSLGYLFWLIFTPLCFGVFLLAHFVFVEWLGQKADRHPATLFAPMAGTREWILFVMQVAVIAPVLEELLFRGVLLPWLVQRRPKPTRRSQEVLVPHERRADLILIFALLISVAWQWSGLTQAIRQGDLKALLERVSPLFFILSLASLHYTLPHWKWFGRKLRLRSPHEGRAIIASAALFGAIHFAWPTPVPLFVLGMILGYLAIRTRNIIPCVFMHSLFNTVSVIYMLRGGVM
jgi:membrane protease YdiL (CAAX protease family)